MPITALSSTDSRRAGRFRVVFAGLLIVLALSSLDQNILNTSLPFIVSDFGGLSRLSWVVTAFLLTSTVSMPIYGRLADRYGAKQVLVSALALFLFGSALCGAAQSLL